MLDTVIHSVCDVQVNNQLDKVFENIVEGDKTTMAEPAQVDLTQAPLPASQNTMHKMQNHLFLEK